MMLQFHLSSQGTLDKNKRAQRPGMRLRVLWGLVVAWILLTACAPPLRGRYTWGHEVNTIQRCDSKDIYWVRCDQPMAARLRAFVEQHTDHPYTSVYIEFRGQLLDERPDGFAANYDGVFKMEDILSLQATVPGDCGVF